MQQFSVAALAGDNWWIDFVFLVHLPIFGRLGILHRGIIAPSELLHPNNYATTRKSGPVQNYNVAKFPETG